MQKKQADLATDQVFCGAGWDSAWRLCGTDLGLAAESVQICGTFGLTSGAAAPSSLTAGKCLHFQSLWHASLFQLTILWLSTAVLCHRINLTDQPFASKHLALGLGLI